MGNSSLSESSTVCPRTTSIACYTMTLIVSGLSGMHGVHRAQREHLNAVADGRESMAQFVTLGTADGMANPETNGGENQPAGWKARDGRLWFPTVQGVVVIDPKSV